MKIQNMMYMLWKKITNLTMNNIGYLGANITQGKTNDTYAFWVDKPSGEVYFNTVDMLNEQPNRYGVLYHDNFYTGYINQTFTTPTGVVYRRHANGSTSSTFTDWVLADTWKANSSTQEGYVAAGGDNNKGKAWTVDPDGTPKWVNTISYIPPSGDSISFTDVGVASNVELEVFLEAWLKYVTANYYDELTTGKFMVGIVNPNSLAYVWGTCYKDTPVQNGLPRYSLFTVSTYGGNYVKRFGTTNYTFWCHNGKATDGDIVDITKSKNTLTISRRGGTTFNQTLTSNDILFLGENIPGEANDTRTFWKEKGTGYAYCSQLNMVNGQPSRWGWILNLVNGDEVQQVWLGQSNHRLYQRFANAQVTTMPSWYALGQEIVSTQTFTYNNNGTKSFVFNRVGNVIFMDSPVDIGDLPTGTTTLGILKEDLRPKYLVRLRPGNSPMNYNFFFSIDTNGTVALYTATAITGPANCALHTSYLASDI